MSPDLYAIPLFHRLEGCEQPMSAQTPTEKASGTHDFWQKNGPDFVTEKWSRNWPVQASDQQKTPCGAKMVTISVTKMLSQFRDHFFSEN